MSIDESVNSAFLYNRRRVSRIINTRRKKISAILGITEARGGNLRLFMNRIYYKRASLFIERSFRATIREDGRVGSP